MDRGATFRPCCAPSRRRLYAPRDLSTRSRRVVPADVPFVPLAAFVVSVADLLLPDEGRDAVARRLASIVPGRALDPSVEHALTSSRVPPTIVGLISLAFPLWAASGMMASIRIAFRIIWENDRRRTYVESKLLDLTLVLGVGVVVIASFGATLLAQVLAEIGHDLSQKLGAATEGRAVAVAAEILRQRR